MKKTTIAFTIDHVFRNVYDRIVDLYKKHNIEIPQSEADDNDGLVTKFEINESGQTQAVEYVFVPPVLKLPITSNDLLQHIPFNNIDDMNDFIFSEFPLEIFGYSKEFESGSIVAFNYWLQELPKNVEVVLISNETSKTKPATLFFLSKTGFEGDNIKFISDSIDIWNLCDILITGGEIKNSTPDNKKMIIIEREYNKNLTGDMKFSSIFDFFDTKIEVILKMNKSNNKQQKKHKK